VKEKFYKFYIEDLDVIFNSSQGRAKAQAVSRRPGFESRSGHVGLWWTKWHWDKFPPSISVPFANSHSTDCSTLIIYHPGLYNRPKSGRRTKWTKSHPTPQETKKTPATVLRKKEFHPTIFIPVTLTWSIGYPRNASFHFSFLILESAGLSTSAITRHVTQCMWQIVWLFCRSHVHYLPGNLVVLMYHYFAAGKPATTEIWITMYVHSTSRMTRKVSTICSWHDAFQVSCIKLWGTFLT
jgi:hypothetical protein